MLNAIELDTPETFGRGDEKIWTSGFCHALLQQNFGFDSAATPRIKTRDIADFYGVKVGSMQQRSAFIREALGLDPLDGRFLIPAMREEIEGIRREMGQVVAAMTDAPIEEVMAKIPRFGKPKSSKSEFIDRDRPVMQALYEIGGGATRMQAGKLQSELHALIERDPDFFDTYAMLAGLLYHYGHAEKAQIVEEEAGKRARDLVCGRSGRWPKKLEWGWLENRHIIRALDKWAHNLWSQGRDAEALELFRYLLASNAEDNIGARHAILAIRLGLEADSWDSSFIESNGAMNVQAVFDWFDRESPKFPDEFAEWRRAVNAD